MLAPHASASRRAPVGTPGGEGIDAQRLLIRDGFVVSMDPDLGDVPNADVFVEDGKIVEFGRGLAVSDAGRSTRPG